MKKTACGLGLALTLALLAGAGFCLNRNWDKAAGLPDTEDPDRFVEALRAWPAQKLAACNYVVGTMAFIAAEVRYPMEAGLASPLRSRSRHRQEPLVVMKPGS
jgi:hypothetical protein